MAKHQAGLAALAAVAVAVYTLMFLGYRSQWEWLNGIDSSALEALHGYGVRHPGWVSFWDVFCTVAGPAGFRVLGVVVIVVALVQRNLRAVLFVLVSIELSGFVTQAAKTLAHRPRPAGALAEAASSSFPSGHAVAVMAGVLALCAVVLPVLRPAPRTAVMVIGPLIVLAIGFGRVALAVHHPSDVLAGWALGYLYFFACLLVIKPTPLLRAAVEIPEVPGNAR